MYDVTPVDRFTHGLSGMAVTTIILNLYLTKKREFYYVVSIGASWIAFILWEVYELIWFFMVYVYRILKENYCNISMLYS